MKKEKYLRKKQEIEVRFLSGSLLLNRWLESRTLLLLLFTKVYLLCCCLLLCVCTCVHVCTPWVWGKSSGSFTGIWSSWHIRATLCSALCSRLCFLGNVAASVLPCQTLESSASVILSQTRVFVTVRVSFSLPLCSFSFSSILTWLWAQKNTYFSVLNIVFGTFPPHVLAFVLTHLNTRYLLLYSSASMTKCSLLPAFNGKSEGFG